MMRRFIAANFILGVFMAACSVAAFAFLKLPYFYFLGIISGFFSLVPYLGVILALFVPLTAGIGILNTTGILIVVVTVSALHVIATTVLYPKFIGGRLRLNPLVVSIGLLVWGACGEPWGWFWPCPCWLPSKSFATMFPVYNRGAHGWENDREQFRCRLPHR
jgi:predicted PurR-regulated permease PerM